MLTDRVIDLIEDQAKAVLRLRWLWFSCGFGMLVLTAFLSLMPVSGVGGNDKLGHILMYACLSSWFSLLVIRYRSLWWVLIGLIAYGLLMEFLQGLTDYRSAEIADAIANSIGAGIGLAFRFTRLRDWLIGIDHRLSALWQ